MEISQKIEKICYALAVVLLVTASTIVPAQVPEWVLRIQSVEAKVLDVRKDVSRFCLDVGRGVIGVGERINHPKITDKTVDLFEVHTSGKSRKTSIGLSVSVSDMELTEPDGVICASCIITTDDGIRFTMDSNIKSNFPAVEECRFEMAEEIPPSRFWEGEK